MYLKIKHTLEKSKFYIICILIFVSYRTEYWFCIRAQYHLHKQCTCFLLHACISYVKY